MADVGACEPWIAACPCPVEGASPAVTGLAAQAATDVLWALSGRRFGECIVELLPCREGCDDSWTAGFQPWAQPFSDRYPFPALIGGAWFNLGCTCTGSCSCNVQDRILLPAPVSRVVQVEIDGAIVPTGSYRLENWRYLVRLDGQDWPMCNDGNWVVTVVYGHEVPALGLTAVGELACEIVRACVQSEECGLPINVQRLVRQGVTQEFVTPESFLGPDGRIGLYFCDLFVSTFNPNRLMSRPRVYSPDRLGPRRVVS